MIVMPSIVSVLLLSACGGNKMQNQQPLAQQVMSQQPVTQQAMVQQTISQQQVAQQPVQTQMPQQAMQGGIPQQGGYIPQQNMQQVSVSLDQAKIAAVTHAGLNLSNVTFTKTVQDYDDGIMKWEIDFVSGNNFYEYDVNAYNASIIKFEVKQVGYNQGGYIPQQPVQGQVPQQGGYVPQQPVQGQVPQQGGYVPQQNGYVPQQGMQQAQGIDMESAKSIATSNAGFNVGNVTFTKTKYDFDDGIAKWEIEFVANNMKYEYEIAASNGAVVKSEVESVFDD